MKKMKKASKNKRRGSGRIVASIVFGIVFTLAVTIFVACDWFNKTYNLNLAGLLYTMTSPLKGTGASVIALALKSCLPKIIIAVFVYCTIAFVICQKRVLASIEILGMSPRKIFKLDLLKLCRRLGAFMSVLLLIASLVFVEKSLNVIDYCKLVSQTTDIYENYYVDPLSVDITSSDGAAKNIIYIYLESMETTYASVEDGGYQDINYIPNLTQLANENISFSNSGLLGGFHAMTGSGWTLGAIFATSTGVPFAFPVENSMNIFVEFAAGITALGDILESEGYNQEFLCGSDADFAGRRDFYEQHGNYEIFDYYTAIEKGYIDEDYYVWWGFEDSILFDIAKDEVIRLAAENEPFNLTMLTVDAHHVGGYVCSQCGDEYDDQLANVLVCTDNQVMEFVRWCMEQDFYEDTVIVIIGDHPRMDNYLVEGVEYYDRTVYNCFINADKNVQMTEENREFTTVDIFPTVLSAMGFDIDGGRLGLGTDLFSSNRTLTEVLGFDYLNSELSKNSEFYMNNFS